MTRRTEFISPAYYTSMGFAVPASVGAGMANRDHRALVIVGDGAFQMTGMELSTIARNGLNPIVVVLNNHGYTTERFLLEGSFNDVHEWKFHKIPEVLGTGLGLEVRTEGELDAALEAALANTGELQPAQRPPRQDGPEPRPGAAGDPARQADLSRGLGAGPMTPTTAADAPPRRCGGRRPSSIVDRGTRARGSGQPR